mgnify:CR=1 FL=1
MPPPPADRERGRAHAMSASTRNALPGLRLPVGGRAGLGRLAVERGAAPGERADLPAARPSPRTARPAVLPPGRGSPGRCGGCGAAGRRLPPVGPVPAAPPLCRRFTGAGLRRRSGRRGDRHGRAQQAPPGRAQVPGLVDDVPAPGPGTVRSRKRGPFGGLLPALLFLGAVEEARPAPSRAPVGPRSAWKSTAVMSARPGYWGRPPGEGVRRGRGRAGPAGRRPPG